MVYIKIVLERVDYDYMYVGEWNKSVLINICDKKYLVKIYEEVGDLFWVLFKYI